MTMMIEDFGAGVVRVWDALRPATRSLVERALQSSNAGLTASPSTRGVIGPYDARADLELSRLLAALDARATEVGGSLNAEQSQGLRRMAETTASVLQIQTQSAEVFAQLVARAHSRCDYARIDALADVLAARFAPSEICELARQPNVVVRALAQETLAQSPTSVLVALLADPIDADVARDALERQAADYGLDEARRLVSVLDQVDAIEDDV